MRDLFERARKAAPAIVFIDELDAAGRRRGAGIGQGNDEREQTLNQLLVEMDGFDADAGIVVMGATNRPDILDPALLRPGRFDRQVTIDVPDVHGRYEILELHCGSRPLAPDVSLLEIAKLSPGFTGAELANVINEAALLTVREGHKEIQQGTLEEAIDRVVAGPAKKSHVLTKAEQWMIAVHEASHAVVTRVDRPDRLRAEAVDRGARAHDRHGRAHAHGSRPGGRAGARPAARSWSRSWPAPPESGSSTASSRPECTTTCMPPRTSRARMVTSFGMSETIGPVTIGEREGEVFLGASLRRPRQHRTGDAGGDRPGGRAVRHRGDRARRTSCWSATGPRSRRPRPR